MWSLVLCCERLVDLLNRWGYMSFTIYLILRLLTISNLFTVRRLWRGNLLENLIYSTCTNRCSRVCPCHYCVHTCRSQMTVLAAVSLCAHIWTYWLAIILFLRRCVCFRKSTCWIMRIMLLILENLRWMIWRCSDWTRSLILHVLLLIVPGNFLLQIVGTWFVLS